MFIREPFAERIIISRKISFMSLVSDIGGLMGLCMGFSFVSIIEILFHAFKVGKMSCNTQCKIVQKHVLTFFRFQLQCFNVKITKLRSQKTF